MHRIANPCRSVRLRPAPPNFSLEINKIAPKGAFCFVISWVLFNTLLDRNWTVKNTSSLKRHQALSPAMPRTIRILDFCFLNTPPYPHPPFSRWPSQDRLITVSWPQYKNSRSHVQRWTSGQYEHVAQQSWVVQRSIRTVGGGVPLQKSSLTLPHRTPTPLNWSWFHPCTLHCVLRKQGQFINFCVTFNTDILQKQKKIFSLIRAAFQLIFRF